MNQTAESNSYLTAVMTLYMQMPETPMRVSSADCVITNTWDRAFSQLEHVEPVMLCRSGGRLTCLPPPSQVLFSDAKSIERRAESGVRNHFREARFTIAFVTHIVCACDRHATVESKGVHPG